MKRNKSSFVLDVMIFLFIVFTTFSIICVEARKHHTKKSKTHKHHKQKGEGSGHSAPGSACSPGPAPSPLPRHCPYPNRSNSFNILSFGAKGDGISDDSKVGS